MSDAPALRRLPLVGALALGALAGCSSRTHTFRGYENDAVWRAMVAVAETPQYDDWKVRDNEVWVDDEERRIEILRELHRLHVTPDAPPRREQRTWRFEIRMIDEAPPQAEFVSRGFAVPAHAQIEAKRYFRDVEHVLIGIPIAAPSAPAGETP